MNNPKTIRAIEKALYAFLDIYFTARDTEGTYAYFSDFLTGFGSSKDENAFDVDQAKAFFARDIREAPNPIHFTIEQLTITAPNDETGFVTFFLSISTVLHKQVVSFNRLRYTLSFIKKADQWQIAQKHLSFPSSITGSDEGYPVKELEARYQTVKRLVDEKTEALEEALEKITTLANTDSLTNLPNRHFIESRLASQLKHLNGDEALFAIIMVDIDSFKTINDTYGHLKGDTILRAMAHTLASQLETSENIGRWGGEEFIILCPGCSEQETMKKAEAIRQDLSQKTFDNIGIQTASFGIASYQKGDTVESMIMRGDRALYEAKRLGKNRVVVYKP